MLEPKGCSSGRLTFCVQVLKLPGVRTTNISPPTQNVSTALPDPGFSLNVAYSGLGEFNILLTDDASWFRKK